MWLDPPVRHIPEVGSIVFEQLALLINLPVGILVQVGKEPVRRQVDLNLCDHHGIHVGKELFVDALPTNRLLAKLGKAVKIADTSNQGKAKSKAASTVAVTLREDAKPFDKTDCVFNKDPLS